MICVVCNVNIDWRRGQITTPDFPTCIDEEEVPADNEPCERGWDVAGVGEGQEHCPHLGQGGGTRL